MKWGIGGLLLAGYLWLVVWPRLVDFSRYLERRADWQHRCAGRHTDACVTEGRTLHAYAQAKGWAQ